MTMPNRDKEIMRLRRAGGSVRQIALQINASREYVRLRLAAMHQPSGVYPVNPMWSMDDDDRRDAIRRRAAAGAHAALERRDA
jgi:hypothetical protein